MLLLWPTIFPTSVQVIPNISVHVYTEVCCHPADILNLSDVLSRHKGLVLQSRAGSVEVIKGH
jgi:hypothetical protein